MSRSTYYNSRKYRRFTRIVALVRIVLMLLVIATFIAILATRGRVGLLFTGLFCLGGLENLIAGLYALIDENRKFSIWTFLFAAFLFLMAFFSVGFFRSGGFL